MAGTNKAGTKLANNKYSWWTAWLVFFGWFYYFGLNLTRMLLSLLSDQTSFHVLTLLWIEDPKL